MIEKKDMNYDEFFRTLPYLEKRQLLTIFSDEYFSYLHEEIVQRKSILTSDKFWGYIKDRYSYKIDFLSSFQPIQFSSKT